MPTLYRYPISQNKIRSGLTTPSAALTVRSAVRSGQVDVKTYTMKEGDRLDIIAHREYGDARLWWIIAAASDIGWWMQLPAGTFLRIPTDLTKIGQII